MDIKIVGTISDEDELDEIQNIAKIFVYEQRLKGISASARVEKGTPLEITPSSLVIDIPFSNKIFGVRGLM